MNSEVQPAIFGRFSRVVGAFSHTITVIPFRCHFGDMIIRQKAVVASVGDGHLFQTGCPGRRLDPGIPTASNVDLTTAPFRASPDSTVRR